MNFLKEYVSEKEVKLAIVGTVIVAFGKIAVAAAEQIKDAKNLECSFDFLGILSARLKTSK